MKTLALAAAAALSLICASAVAQEAPAQQPIPATEPAQMAGDQPNPVAPAATPVSETGRIVFFRPSRINNAIYAYRVVEVGDDGKPTPESPVLGSLKNGGAFSVEVEPRLHTFNLAGPMSVNKADDRLRMEVEPGATYYVEQQVRMGMMTAGFRLVPADEARFIASKAKLVQAED
jgi:hypothetical protein